MKTTQKDEAQTIQEFIDRTDLVLTHYIMSMNQKPKIAIKYFNTDYPVLEKIPKGDWIDLRIDSIKDHRFVDKDANHDYRTDKILKQCGEIHYGKGEIITFGLGVAMELPEGYEAIVAPRSSTFKHWGFIQTNGIGVIDNTYCGNDDEWSVQFLTTRSGSIRRFDRVCQFRIQKNQPALEFKTVSTLDNPNREGRGSTGKA